MYISLNKEEKNQLLKITRESISDYLNNGKIQKYEDSSFSPALLQKAGAFVTLHKKGDLRGCIGRFGAEEPLYSIVQRLGISSATKDRRFSTLQPEELPEVDIEISVLSPLKKIHSPDEFDPDKHGIYLKMAGRSGTFLPQVAKQTGWTKEELLGRCARDKAGLNWDDWKNAELFIYTAQIFSE